MGKQKLELSWIGKDKRPRLEPRILIEKSSLSYHAKNKVLENDLFDSKLIFGDNLLALKALEKDYAGKVKCIYIDPPYNTGNAFEYYDDGLEHSIWLGLIRDRLEILKNLLSIDGVIFVQIDDVEQAYLRVLMDEVFGRSNFINTISVNLKNVAGASGGGEDKKLKKNIEYIHVYTKDYLNFNSFKGVYDYIPISELVENYRQEDKSWKYTTILIYAGDKEYLGSTVDGDGNEIKIFTRKNPIIKSINQIIREENLSEAKAYDKYASKIFQTQMPQSSIRPRVMEKAIELGSKEDLHSIEYIPKTGRNKGTVYEQYYKGGNFRLLAWLSDVSEEKNGVLCKKEAQGTYWDFVGHTKNLSKEGAVTFPNGKKPEALIQRILEMSTEPGDLVLDSFAGSGTTGAVAHKMGRRWIMIELGEHCHSHIIPRLKKVINGEDRSGATESASWQGGGGFRYYTLAPSLMKKDQWDNWVINPEYNQEMLVEALCKLEGYIYAPSETEYWNHGKGSDTDFIYVTTQTLTDQQLQAISEEVGEGRTLLIIVSAWRSKNIDRFTNLTLKKIPNSIIKACEWGHDDYSLNVQNLPMSEPDIEEKTIVKKVKNTKEQSQVTGDLFGDQT